MNSSALAPFRRSVWAHYKTHGRHDLPWRKTKDPYRIMVSEVMLQQTQVSRVLEKYKEFLKRFPTPHALAQAPLADVLKTWSGLGYNRRGKYLHEAAKKIVKEFGGNLNDAIASNKLPGVGPYTRAAIKAFAFNELGIFIETNIRTAFIHHFFPKRTSVSDRELIPLVERVAAKQDPRTWNWALMDYGSHLKKNGVRNNVQSAHYTRQSKFKGSLREVRGAIVRELHKGKPGLYLLPFDRTRIERSLASLTRDGLIVKEKGMWRIA